MSWWQVRAGLGAGRLFSFGVQAEDKSAAWTKAEDLLIQVDGWQGPLFTKLLKTPPPEDRLTCR